MSKQSIQPAWKQEVNQRLAAHKNRKGTAGESNQKIESPKPGSSRAAEAAARVAARYAAAPSYTQMQAEEARVAVRAAEIATQVAIEAQAVAESALAGLHAATVEQPMRGPAVIESITRPATAPALALESNPESDHELMTVLIEDPPATASTLAFMESETLAASVAADRHSVVTKEVVDGMSLNLRWEPDLPTRAVPMPAPDRTQEQFELAVEDWWTPAQVSASLHNEPIEVDSQQSHANLIEFPRELIAARKMRPRMAETAAGAIVEPEVQLSIFEVDPGSISTEPTTERLIQESASAAWTGPVWSGMELDAHPARQEAPQNNAPSKHGPFLAPLGLRLLAMVVDGSLILAAFFAAATWLASRMSHVPAQKPAEIMAASGLIFAGFAYHAFFFMLARSTPGMHYAGIGLCTFEDDVPTRLQLRSRLGAMALSLLPVGLGLVWSVFDEDHLSWHDRISGTYLRKR